MLNVSQIPHPQLADGNQSQYVSLYDTGSRFNKQIRRCKDKFFLHAKPWIPGGAKSIFTVVIHKWRSPMRQFARARTIDEYDATMPVPHVRVTSQINCSEVTMLSQKIPSLVTMAKSAIDNWFFSELRVQDIKWRVRSNIMHFLYLE